jgi:hypothetical protein
MIQTFSKARITSSHMAGACHEAGHAVAARHLGLIVAGASYNHSAKSGERCGRVKHSSCGIFSAFCLIAGQVAELRAIGQKDSQYVRLCGWSDREQFRKLVHDYLSAAQFEAYQRKLEDDVAGFLYQPEVWKLLHRFAEELLRHGSLTHRDCMSLTKDVPRARLVDIQQTMLDPNFHNHIGRRIGLANRLHMENLIREAVEKLRPAFGRTPPLSDIYRAFIEEGYSEEEAERLWLEVYGFWLKPAIPV